MSDRNIFTWKYRENNYICKYDIIRELNDFVYKIGSYEKLCKWHEKHYEEECKISKEELIDLMIYLINCDWKYILDCNNPSFENYVNDNGELEFDNPNCKWILRVDNDKKKILENVLCNLFTCCDDLYVIYKKM